MKVLSIISIPVTDQDKAKEFYIQLGFKLLLDNRIDEKQRWVQLQLPDTQTSITLVNWFENMQPGSIRGLVLDVDDIHAEAAGLEEKGIKVGQIDKTPWGLFATVKDPDGNAISLHQNR